MVLGSLSSLSYQFVPFSSVQASGDLPEHLAYLLDQSTSSANAGSADEDDPMSVVASSSEADVRGEKSKSQDEKDEEVAQFKRRKELTDKYIAGKAFPTLCVIFPNLTCCRSGQLQRVRSRDPP